MRRKQHFNAISGINTRHNYTPEDYVHGQEIFKTIIQFPNHERVTALSTRLEPLWAQFRKHGGSIRVIAAAAGVLGLTDTDCLPRPLQPLSASDIAGIARVISTLELK